MPMRLSKKLTRINERLCHRGQALQIIGSDGEKVHLNNGRNVEKSLFYQRARKKHYIEQFDIIYGEDIERAEETIRNLKREACSKGGKRVQELYPEIRVRATENVLEAFRNGGIKHLRKGWGWSKGKTKSTSDGVRRISERKLGSRNPSWGKSPSSKTRERQSIRIKKRIKEGKFTPNLYNSKTHWQVEFKGRRYRSSWEAAFHGLNPDYEYETLRIEIDGRIVIVDFYLPAQKKAVEIKPKRHQSIQKRRLDNISQTLGMRGITFQILGEEFLVERWDEIQCLDFDSETMRKLNKARNEADKKNKN